MVTLPRVAARPKAKPIEPVTQAKIEEPVYPISSGFVVIYTLLSGQTRASRVYETPNEAIEAVGLISGHIKRAVVYPLPESAKKYSVTLLNY